MENLKLFIVVDGEVPPKDCIDSVYLSKKEVIEASKQLDGIVTYVLEEELKLTNEAKKQLLLLLGVCANTKEDWTIYQQLQSLKARNKKLQLMIENGLGAEDMQNDI